MTCHLLAVLGVRAFLVAACTDTHHHTWPRPAAYGRSHGTNCFGGLLYQGAISLGSFGIWGLLSDGFWEGTFCQGLMT